MDQFTGKSRLNVQAVTTDNNRLLQQKQRKIQKRSPTNSQLIAFICYSFRRSEAGAVARVLTMTSPLHQSAVRHTAIQVQFHMIIITAINLDPPCSVALS